MFKYFNYFLKTLLFLVPSVKIYIYARVFRVSLPEAKPPFLAHPIFYPRLCALFNFLFLPQNETKLKPIINTRTRFSFIILRCWRFPWPFLVPQTFLPFDAAKASLVEYHSHTHWQSATGQHTHTLTHSRT